MLVVGQFAQAADVSAVSTGSWLMQLITAFVVGIAMGTTILLGRKIGEGRAEEGGKIIGASIMPVSYTHLDVYKRQDTVHPSR